MPKCLQPHTGFLAWMSEVGQDGQACQQECFTGVGQSSLCSSCRNTLFIGRNLKVGGRVWRLEIARWLFSLLLSSSFVFRYQQWDAQVPCVQWQWVCISPVHTTLDSSSLDCLSYGKRGKVLINSWHTLLFGIMTRLLCLPYLMPAEPLLLPSISSPFLLSGLSHNFCLFDVGLVQNFWKIFSSSSQLNLQVWLQGLTVLTVC